MADLKTYSNAYQYVRLDRRDGILQVQIHHRGGAAIWDAAPNGIHARAWRLVLSHRPRSGESRGHFHRNRR